MKRVCAHSVATLVWLSICIPLIISSSIKPLSPRQFVQKHSGVYTVIPYHCQRLLDPVFHYNRLCDGLTELCKNDILTGERVNIFNELAIESFHSSIKSVLPASADDGLITVCLSSMPNGNILFDSLFTHRPYNALDTSIEESANEEKLRVSIHLFSRSLPNVKQCSWTADRVFIEETRPDDVSEVLLARQAINGDMSLLEGLTSSFAVLEEGVLVAASSDDVLEGSMLALVLQACARLGIAVRRETPQISRACIWSGAFLSSKYLYQSYYQICVPGKYVVI
jgi:Amino-transferase class IV